MTKEVHTFFFETHDALLITWLVFYQVKRQFYGWESNHQPLRSIWVSLHYHHVV